MSLEQSMVRTPLVVAFGLCLVTACSKSPPPAAATAPSSGSTATITATPNPVPAGPGPGTTMISWDTGDGTLGEVYVAPNGGAEKRFSGKRAKGSQEANWIGKGAYEFRLYSTAEPRTVLASVRVARATDSATAP
jgi:hypothetical protein